MKTTLIAFLAVVVSACGAQQKTFEISADTLPQDKAWLTETVSDINDHLGCEQLIVATASQNFGPDDIGHGYNFISFSNIPSVKDDLDGGSKASSNDILGETVVGVPGETDIMLTSFTMYPTSDTCVQSDNGCKVIYPKRLAALAKFVDAHEFGHAMGLEHSKNPNDIMFPTAGAQVNENGITDTQWAAYVDQLSKAGVVCPKGGYGVSVTN